MYSQNMTKRVLVIGGGIAGPVTAMALQKVGFQPVVYEAYERGADGVGAFLTLAVNGLAALELLDLRRPVEQLGMDTPAMTLHDRHGRELATLPTPARTVSRGKLYTTLRDEAARRGIPVEYGRRLTDATTTPTGVRATFADGSTADGAFLVGADGLRSRTRTLIDPNAPRPRHVGLLNVGGYAHGLRLPRTPGVAHFISGRRCFFGYFQHPDGDVWWFANPPSRREPRREDLLAVSTEQWRSRVLDLFRTDGGPARQIVAASQVIFPGWNTYDFPTVPRWHNDRMVIIGDAAHATSPSSGQGASMAIEDAVVLARWLRDSPTPAAAFAGYERERRNRVEKVVRYGKRNGDGKAQGPLRAMVGNLVVPLVMRHIARTDALSWLHDHRVSWDTPGDQKSFVHHG